MSSFPFGKESTALRKKENSEHPWDLPDQRQTALKHWQLLAEFAQTAPAPSLPPQQVCVTSDPEEKGNDNRG